ncbi:MAG: cysteine hydrolase [Phycisphaerae bacterium]|nr:cysteine hydrolase [Phycisphaerae bacterium]
MPARKENAHIALLVVDVINDLEFPGGENVLPWAQRMVGRLRDVMARARQAEVPVIYVNDNFGRWRSNFKEVIDYCTRPGARGAEISRALSPGKDDYFILKPKHSGFFATSLVPLLEFLEVDRLVLCGIATNLCVLYTAHDAQMHEYEITVLSDCCAAESDDDHNWGLSQLQRFAGVRVCRSDELDFEEKSSAK